MLTRDDILKCTSLPREPVEAFGGTLYVRTMTGAERDSWEAQLLEQRKRGKVNVRASLAVRAICDEAIRAAATDERKTVLDRDVPRLRR